MKYNFNNKIKEFNKKGYVVFENVIDLKDLKKIKSNFKKIFMVNIPHLLFLIK